MSAANSRRAPAIAHLRYYKNETNKGSATASKAKRSVHYYSRGVARDQEAERGIWYTPDGNTESSAEVERWASEQALDNKYTYQIVLSLRDGQVDEHTFLEAMKDGGVFTDFRLIQHRDSRHDHAHIMGFRPKVLRKREFDQFRQQTRAFLEKAEEVALSMGHSNAIPELGEKLETTGVRRFGLGVGRRAQRRVQQLGQILQHDRDLEIGLG